ncbi:hypothetical protein GCM10027063_45790 [Promicromonospora xylanilytica]
MTHLPAPAPRRVIARFPATVLIVLLAVVLVALVTVAPAAALRSGPDLAVRVDAGPGAAGVNARPGAAGATGYVPPVAGVDPPAGVERRFDPPAQRWGAGHRGVDLTAAHGSSVLSPGAGVVTFAGPVARRGVLVVTHPDGLRSSLEPVAASVAVGTAVTAGERIGTVEGGDAAGGTSPSHCAPRSCLHWGVRRGERYIDPLSLLDRPPIVLLPDH